VKVKAKQLYYRKITKFLKIDQDSIIIHLIVLQPNIKRWIGFFPYNSELVFTLDHAKPITKISAFYKLTFDESRHLRNRIEKDTVLLVWRAQLFSIHSKFALCIIG